MPLTVNNPLSAELVCGATLCRHMHPDDLSLLEQTVTWRREPEFPRMGRSAWIRLAHPFRSPSGEAAQVIRSLKVKGVGLRDHRGVTKRPSTGVYRRPDAHLGFDESGGFCELLSAPAPMGGLTLSRAMIEYTTASELCAAGGSAEIPLLVYRYSKMAGFRDDSGSVSDLGVLVAGLPADTPIRADNLVHYARQPAAVQAALRHWARDHTGAENFNWADAQLALWREYGKRLREFHACGFYRHNSNACNIGLGSNGVFLVDLDSTRSLLECSPYMRGLQVLRDVAGALFHIIDATLRSAEIKSVENAADMNDAAIDAFLCSYFSDVSCHTFQEVKIIAGSIASEFWDTWSRSVDEVPENGGSAGREYRQFMTERHSHRSRGIDGPALFSRLMPGLTTPYGQSKVAYQGGPLLTRDVEQSAEVFLLQRKVGVTSPQSGTLL
jgi:hypothetical protein